MQKIPGHADVIRAIRDSLSPELLSAYYRTQITPDDAPETGHCAIAAEAFYHLAGGKAAGFVPVVCGFDTPDGRQTHWWIRGPKNGKRGTGEIFDPTIAQFPQGFDYTKGRNTGFMQPQQKPSKRAQTIIERVTAKLGKSALDKYRMKNIRAFTKPPAPPLSRQFPHL